MSNLLLLTGQHGQGRGGRPTSGAPILSANPASGTFSGVLAGGSNPAPQTIHVTNIGGGTLAPLVVTVTGSGVGLVATQVNVIGGNLNTQDVVVTPTAPPVSGVYDFTVNIASPGATSQPLGVVFGYTVTSITPFMSVSTSTLTLPGFLSGATTTPQTLTIGNTAGGTLNTVVPTLIYPNGQPIGWATPTTGGAGNNQTVTLVGVPGTLPIGVYPATLRISASNAANGFVDVAVFMAVQQPGAMLGPVHQLPSGGTPQTTVTWNATRNDFDNKAVDDAFPVFGGTVRHVSAPSGVGDTAALLAALAASDAGDIIDAEPGTYTISSYAGFVLWKKVASGYTWFRVSTYQSLPAYSTTSFTKADRVNPTAHAAYCVRLRNVQAGGQPAYSCDLGGNHWWLTGIIGDVAKPSNVTQYTDAVVNLSSYWQNYENIPTRPRPAAPPGIKNRSDQPHHITLDRCMVLNSGIPLQQKKGINAYASHLLITHSHVGDIEYAGADSQGINFGNTDGPCAVYGNFVCGMAENIMSGGFDPSIAGQTPRNLDVRWNHLYKPPAWRTRTNVKNHFELKDATEVLYAYNVAENMWPNAQPYSIVLTPVNQSGNNPTAEVRNVTIWANLHFNINGGCVNMHPWNQKSITVNGVVIQTPVVGMSNLEIAWNCFVQGTETGTSGFGQGSYAPFQAASATNHGIPNLKIHHNTFFSTREMLELPTSSTGVPDAGADFSGLDFSDNVNARLTSVGPIRTNSPVNLAALTAVVPNGQWRVQNNVNGFTAKWATTAGTGLLNTSTYKNKNAESTLVLPGDLITDVAGGDYSIKAGSKYKNSGSDGNDPGVNMGYLAAHTAGIR